MTSIEYIIKQLEEQGLIYKSINNELSISISSSDYLDIKRLAKEMHKQEIIDAYNNGDLRSADLYYQETFISKGSDEAPKCTCNVDTFICQIHGTSDGKTITAF